ncbi:hypothetical protein BPOR_0770g00060 [Botrytis porri]|uniref:Uncharacterized protein n=1 Tax=Botrytis porri TaxID=87229 RepID=A0A4Z1K9P3_9HELO|nr:hypothetical protein BPOR_0770g00060 [Botrytis porri]
MPPQPMEHKLMIMMAAMSQFSSNEKDVFPVPNYTILAEQLGLPSYASAQGVWKRLTDELKEGAKGDLKIRDPEADKKKKVTVQQNEEESPSMPANARPENEPLRQEANRKQELPGRRVVWWKIKAGTRTTRLESAHGNKQWKTTENEGVGELHRWSDFLGKDPRY